MLGSRMRLAGNALKTQWAKGRDYAYIWDKKPKETVHHFVYLEPRNPM